MWFFLSQSKQLAGTLSFQIVHSLSCMEILREKTNSQNLEKNSVLLYHHVKTLSSGEFCFSTLKRERFSFKIPSWILGRTFQL